MGQINLVIVVQLIIKFLVIVSGQNLNVIPNLLRNYVNEFPQLQTLNVLANMSDVVFSNAKYDTSVKLGSYMYQNSYDFIIIGSSPAGCVLANRLSANPKWSVLLIEAGQPESVIQSIPLATSFTASSQYVRSYFFERNSNACQNIVDKECPYLTGVALGGSSAVNNFLYTRGSQDDFDKWQEMGNVGWSYKDLLPYFKKVERRRTISASFSEEISDGALNIEHPRYTTGLLPVYLRAGRELGWKLIDYNNAMDQIGIGIAQGTTLRGRRQSAAGAYIHPTYQDRPNLHILTNTRAMKVLINEETKEAHAVKYKYDGVETVVEAKKEIILSAGAIGSAHLLMLSGVGPKKRLAKASIPVLHELPVGETFYTNVAVHAPHFLVNTSLLSIHIKRLGVKDILELNSGRGVLTSFTGSEALSFLKTPFSESSSNQPDVELQFVSAGLQSDLGMGFRKAAQIKKEVYEQLFSSIENTDNDVWSTVVTNLHSKTRGHLTLVNSDIDTDPILNYPYFEDPSDLKTIVYGIKEAIKMIETQSFRSIGARLHDVPLASCSHFEKDTDQYWECYARHLTVIVPQMVATNRMGPATDPGAVVDQELRVRGIRNLRVADTSVVPTTISGHLQAISYVIGEKLSDILKMEWKSMSNSIRDEY